MKNKSPKKVLKIIIICMLVLSTAVFAEFYMYTLDYYGADHDAVAINAYDGVQISYDGNLTIFNSSNESDTGLIFYPGGKVEHIAYAPLLQKLSQNGVTCVLVEMPFNLALFGANSADTIYDKLPQISRWYIGGHSLGGAMASVYVKDNIEEVSGLILLGAYPSNDEKLPTLAIYGSEDRIVNWDKLSCVDNKAEIRGGNHANFGNYGNQAGDGAATIARDAQQDECVRLIVDFIHSNTASEQH